jgi:hypothetical protein
MQKRHLGRWCPSGQQLKDPATVSPRIPPHTLRNIQGALASSAKEYRSSDNRTANSIPTMSIKFHQSLLKINISICSAFYYADSCRQYFA